MTQWLQAHDLVSTDWDEADPRNRLRDVSEGQASIPCGLLAGTFPCKELFYTEEGRDLHLEEDHGCVGLNLDLRPYDPVYKPPAERKSTPKGEGPGDVPKSRYEPRKRKRRMMRYDR